MLPCMWPSAVHTQVSLHGLSCSYGGTARQEITLRAPCLTSPVPPAAGAAPPQVLLSNLGQALSRVSGNSVMQPRLSQELWAQAAGTCQRIAEHPFLAAVVAGTLPERCFAHYQAQNVLYLRWGASF